jgi:hypothetical protein
MDYFFLDDYNFTETFTETTPKMQMKNDHNALIGTLFGLVLGLLSNATLMCFRNSRKKIDDLTDENESLTEANGDLQTEVAELQYANDRLTADADANERLINRLKSEINSLTYKIDKMDYQMAGLDSDNKSYMNELSEIRNIMRQRNNNTPPPLIRKRQRGEDLDV